ncbi:MAG TPA: mechanosensitive ion channel family protein [Blastocatellia bacterium]|nr:mechanosensitive ion channel family protein [Blastocatellia bacterium]
MAQEWLTRTRDELLVTAQNVIPRVIIALIIFLVGLLAARIARKWLGNALDRSRIRNDQLLRNFFVRSVTLTIVVLAGFSALGQIGWDIRSFLTGLGITGIIIGFGLRDTLSNFASGLLLLIYRPFRAGEVIEIEGSQGTVQELTIVNMQMVTTDGVLVIMPNSKVWGAKIINYSLSQSRRVELNIKVPDSKTYKAIQTIEAGLKKDPRILPDPAPAIQVTSISEKSAALRVWAWTTPQDFKQTGSDLYLKLQSQLNQAEIEML